MNINTGMAVAAIWIGCACAVIFGGASEAVFGFGLMATALIAFFGL